MSEERVVIAGVLALDDLKTPEREGKNLVGGAGVYSSLSACIFSNLRIIVLLAITRCLLHNETHRIYSRF